MKIDTISMPPVQESGASQPRLLRRQGQSSLPGAKISFTTIHSRAKASGISAKGVKKEPLIKEIQRFAKKKKVKLYLVGGYLRDLFLRRKKENPDIDLAVKKGAIRLARDFARDLRAGFVVLDKAHGCARVVKKAKDRVYTIDFTDFRGKDLGEDLRHRDFTINSMALDLDTYVLIDPYNGLADIKKKTLTLVNKKSFDEDALRILRAFSLSSIFGFKIDKTALELARVKKGKLKKISFERIRDELFKILDRDSAVNFLAQMDTMGILDVILPEIAIMRGVEQGPYHHLDVWKHTLETLKQLEAVIKEYRGSKRISDYLNEVISSDRRRRALIKLGALLHDIGKPQSLRHEDGKTTFHGHERVGLGITRVISQRLRLSNDEFQALRKMVFWHLRPGYLADLEEISRRAIFRYFRDTAGEAVSVLLISMADQRATRGPLTSKQSRVRHEKVVRELIQEYFCRQKQKKLPRLITGDDLIKKLRLTPSPLFARILNEVEELQAAGEVRTKKEALEAAKKIIKSEGLG